jgi:hypothetical protein
MASPSSKWGACITTTTELLEVILGNLDHERNLYLDNNPSDRIPSKKAKWTPNPANQLVTKSDQFDIPQNSLPFVGEFYINDSQVGCLTSAHPYFGLPASTILDEASNTDLS